MVSKATDTSEPMARSARSHASRPASIWGAVGVLVFGALLGLYGPGPDAHADAQKDAGSSAQTRANADQNSVKTELAAGGVRATLNAPKPGVLFGAGSSVFTEITLSNDPDSNAVQADLLFEANDGEIAGITGRNTVTAQDGATHMVRIGGLAKDKERTVVVEMKIDDITSPQGRSESRMKITLRVPLAPAYETKVITEKVKKSYCRAYGYGRTRQGRRKRCVSWGKRTATRKKEIKVPVIQAGAVVAGPSDSAVLSWPASNCAQSFYSALLKVREANAGPMGEALKRARTRDRSRPGRWLFRPVSDGPHERKVHRLARTFVGARAIDREMSTQRNYGWVSQKVATDLRTYLKQDAHPAICTGAIHFVDFFDGRMKDFYQRGTRFSKAADDAATIAAERTARERDTLKANRGGDPALTTGTAIAATPDSTPARPGLKALIVETAELTGDAELAVEVRQTTSAYGGLGIMSSWLKKADNDALSKDSRAALARALGTIEAAEYLAVIAGHYTDLRNTIEGSTRAIRDAHEAHCRCDG